MDRRRRAGHRHGVRRRGRPDRGGDDGAEDLPRSWFRDAGNVRARQPQRRARRWRRRYAGPFPAPVPGLLLPGERRARGPHPPPPTPARQPADDLVFGAEPPLVTGLPVKVIAVGWGRWRVFWLLHLAAA